MNGSPMNRNRRAAAPRAITRKTGRTACRMSMASSLLQAKRAIPGKGPPARAAPGEKGARPRGYSPSLLPRRTPFRDEVVDDPPRLRVRDGASVPLLHPRHGRGPARPVLVLSQRTAQRMADRTLGFEQRPGLRIPAARRRNIGPGTLFPSRSGRPLISMVFFVVAGSPGCARPPDRREVVDDRPGFPVRDGAPVDLLHPCHGLGPPLPFPALAQRAVERMADGALGLEQRLRSGIREGSGGSRLHAAPSAPVPFVASFLSVVRPPPRKVRRLNRERGGGDQKERSRQNRTDPFPVHRLPSVLCVAVTSRARRRGTRGSSRHPRRRSSPPSSPASP